MNLINLTGKVDFSTELTNLTKSFTEVLDKSKVLSTKMQESISKKTEEAAKLQAEIADIEVVKAQNEKFASNIAKLLK